MVGKKGLVSVVVEAVDRAKGESIGSAFGFGEAEPVHATAIHATTSKFRLKRNKVRSPPQIDMARQVVGAGPVFNCKRTAPN
jgi:hypothetical protein